jgi:hypothetical protein
VQMGQVSIFYYFLDSTLNIFYSLETIKNIMLRLVSDMTVYT